MYGYHDLNWILKCKETKNKPTKPHHHIGGQQHTQETAWTLVSLWLQPHTQQTQMFCVLIQLSIRASIHFKGSLLCLSSSVGSNHTDRSLLLRCISGPLAHDPVTDSLVVLSWTTFGGLEPLQTRITSQTAYLSNASVFTVWSFVKAAHIFLIYLFLTFISPGKQIKNMFLLITGLAKAGPLKGKGKGATKETKLHLNRTI